MLSGEATVKILCHPSEMVSILKAKNLLPRVIKKKMRKETRLAKIVYSLF